MSIPSEKVGYASISNQMAGNDRLEEQAQAENLDAIIDHLPLVGAKSLLEIACGSGALTRFLAQRALSLTRIDGIDISDAHVCYARKKAEEEGWSHLRYFKKDLFDIKHGFGFYNIVISRYFLMYLMPKSLDLQAICNMAKLCPGGYVACIEADINFGCDRFPQPSQALTQAFRDIEEYYRDTQSIEWRAGIRLYQSMRMAGLIDVHVKVIDGREIQGGQPAGLVAHDSRDLEALLRPVVTENALAMLADEWRLHLKHSNSFQYTPIMLGLGKSQFSSR